MIKTTLRIYSKPEYPILAKGKRTECVVAFTSNTSGCVIQSGKSNLSIFKEYNDLSPLSSGNWTILNKQDELVLSNKF